MSKDFEIEVLDKTGIAIDERSIVALAASQEQLTKAVCVLANICKEQQKTNEILVSRIDRLEDKLDHMGPCTKVGAAIDSFIGCITDLFD